MKLSELKTGESAVIVKVSGHGGFRKRVIEMGFIKGKKVDVLLEWGVKEHIYLLALDESHFDDSLADATVTGYLDDDSTFTCFKF